MAQQTGAEMIAAEPMTREYFTRHVSEPIWRTAQDATSVRLFGREDAELFLHIAGFTSDDDAPLWGVSESRTGLLIGGFTAVNPSGAMSFCDEWLSENSPPVFAQKVADALLESGLSPRYGGAAEPPAGATKP